MQCHKPHSSTKVESKLEAKRQRVTTKIQGWIEQRAGRSGSVVATPDVAENRLSTRARRWSNDQLVGGRARIGISAVCSVSTVFAWVVAEEQKRVN